jgi:hypothetical protein
MDTESSSGPLEVSIEETMRRIIKWGMERCFGQMAVSIEAIGKMDNRLEWA